MTNHPVIRKGLAVGVLLVLQACLYPAWAGGPLVVVVKRKVKPDGRVKIEIEITDAKPITGGDIVLNSNTGLLDAVSGVSVNSKAGDAAGVAVARRGKLTVSFAAPSASVGTAPNTPIVAINVAAPPTPQTPDVRLNSAGTRLLDPNGLPYAHEVGPDAFIASDLSITEVIPSSGFIPSDSTITLNGTGFRIGTTVDIEGVDVSSTRLVSSTQLQLTTDQGFRIDGKRIRVANPDNSIETFYAYPPVATIGQSSRKLLAAAVPIFSRQTRTSGFFFPLATGLISGTNYITGLALQNNGAVAANVTIEVYAPTGVRIGEAAFSLPALSRISREISEWIPGIGTQSAGYIKVRSSQAIQMLELLGDEDRELLSPIAPKAVLPEEPVDGGFDGDLGQPSQSPVPSGGASASPTAAATEAAPSSTSSSSNSGSGSSGSGKSPSETENETEQHQNRGGR